MSRAAKITLGLSLAFAGTVIATVHFDQKRERAVRADACGTRGGGTVGHSPDSRAPKVGSGG